MVNHAILGTKEDDPGIVRHWAKVFASSLNFSEKTSPAVEGPDVLSQDLD